MFFSKIHKRISFLLFMVILIFLVILFKVVYIQVFSYRKLSDLSDKLYNRELPILADRGNIVDRNGKIIAKNITTTSLYFVPSQIKDKKKTAEDIAQILDVDYEKIYKHVSKKASIERVHPEGRGLAFDVADKINSLNYDGVYLVKEGKRYYPYDELLSHILGYVGIDNQGLSGLELEYDNYLTGINGAIKYYSDGKGQRLNKTEVYEESVSGFDLQLTIDLDLQKVVENELDNIVSKYTPDDALIIVSDPSTSEILAMGSRPGFNPNSYSMYSGLTLNRNLPIWKTYEPGSTFKIITLASAIEEKKVDIFSDTFYDSGSVNVDGATLHCWKHSGHGAQTYLQVVQNSCNPGFVSLGLKLGTQTLMDYIKKFGFGKKTGIDLNGESSGILFDTDKMGLVETATTAFGQGISVTPIQQINAVNSVINGGILNTPYVVKNIIDVDNNLIIKSFDTKKKGRVISKDTSDLVKFALENVVANGTGRNAYIENYRVGGKTGTAQVVVDGRYASGNYILSFIGFLPVDDPKVSVYVAISNAHNVTQYGGSTSAPVAKKIMTSAIDILGIEPSKDVMPKVYNWNENKYLVLPDVVGMSKDDIETILKGFKINYYGSGSRILYEEPIGGTYVKEGSYINIMLGD